MVFGRLSLSICGDERPQKNDYEENSSAICSSISPTLGHTMDSNASGLRGSREYHPADGSQAPYATVYEEYASSHAKMTLRDSSAYTTVAYLWAACASTR
jgi:hypothetical protein